MHNQNFLSFLAMKNIIDQDQKRLIEIESTKKRTSVEESIINMNFMSSSTLSKLMKEFRNEDIILSDFLIDIQIIKAVPYNFCVQNNCLPICIKNDYLQIAVTRYEVNLIDALRRFLSFSKTQIIIADRDEIYELIQKNYANVENWIDFMELSDKTAEVFIDRLLLDAVNKNASDIHISPEESIVSVRYRIDGTLRRVCIFHKDYFAQVCIRLKILFSVDITTSMQSRDGSLAKFVFGEKIDFRIAFHKVICGENIVIRVLSNSRRMSLEEIGYSENVLQDLYKMIDCVGGMVILSGETGSGKSTTLYSILDRIDCNSNSVFTIEDPVECRFRGVQQTDINQHPDMTFAGCLRDILRQDPNVIMVGEIRDAETAKIALRAALTGHKVFTTLHAQDIFGVLDRFEEFGLTKAIVLNNVRGIVRQRLVKKKCAKCEDGCKECYYSGSSGRCVIAESLYIDNEVAEILLSNATKEEKISRLIAKGYRSIQQDVEEKIHRGIVNKIAMEWI